MKLLPPADLRGLSRPVLDERLQQALAELEPGLARLVQSRVDLRALLHRYSAWPLIDGPSAWYFLVHPPVEASPLLDPLRQQHQRLFRLYRQAVAAALEGGPCEPLGAAFLDLLERHTTAEEKQLYPLYERSLRESRLIRELGWENLGLRRQAPDFGPFLLRVKAGETTRRDRDGFEIDFFHLLEHHVEREEKALFPALERLCPGELARLTWGD
ncbi:MAG: hemerythrin domain-containing protein [Candidatus Eremiobacterota bacterium]